LAHSFDVSCTCRTAHLSEVDDRKSALIGRTRCVRWCVKHPRNAAVKKRRFRPLAPPPLCVELQRDHPLLDHSRLVSLTPRESEVAMLVTEGF
jgi:hypothetical protein